MASTFSLPTPSGSLAPYACVLRGSVPSNPLKYVRPSRIAYLTAHVVANPFPAEIFFARLVAASRGDEVLATCIERHKRCVRLWPRT